MAVVEAIVEENHRLAPVGIEPDRPARPVTHLHSIDVVQRMAVVDCASLAGPCCVG